MKKIILVLFVMCSVSVFAGDANTNIEQAVQTKGSMFKEEIFTVDNIPQFRVDAIKVTNLEKFNTVSGARVVYKIVVGKEEKLYYNYIDADEIDECLATLQYIKTILKTKTLPSAYTEIKFVSKSGFEIRLYTTIDYTKLNWSFSVMSDNKVEKSFITLLDADIEKLQKTFEQVKAKL